MIGYRMFGGNRFGPHPTSNIAIWLDAIRTLMAVKQKLMRHSNFAITMTIYGDIVTDEMREVHSKVVRAAIRRAN